MSRALDAWVTGDESVCWSCGKSYKHSTGGYCSACWSAGTANPWINCRHCGRVFKRRTPGQTTGECAECRGQQLALFT